MDPRRYGKNEAEAAAAVLIETVARPPRTALFTGTGLGDIAEAMTVAHRWSYLDLPHFPRATGPSHRGELLAGVLSGQPLWVCRGRCHLYEGYPPEAVAFPVRVLQALGVKRLILTNAAGGLNPDFSAGDLMIITDHINLTGKNPLTGANEDSWGPRFPDMSRAYAPEWIARAAAGAANAGLRVQRGVYAGLTGPSLETPAETRYLRRIGADAVGFSTVMETLAAVHAGMQVLGLSLITNIHNPDRPAPTTLEDVLAVADRSAAPLGALIAGLMASGTEESQP
ncbi:MAG: purine-nucleoside phosphorylase [Pseudomonadota bacterium]